MARLSGGTRTRPAGCSRTVPSRVTRPPVSGSSPVSARSVVDFPNGSGKSTTLRALTGLLPLTGGRVTLDGTVLEHPAGRVRVPPDKRAISLMFQDYLLFP